MEEDLLNQYISRILEIHGLRKRAWSDSDSDDSLDDLEQFEQYRPPPLDLTESNVVVITPQIEWKERQDQNQGFNENIQMFSIILPSIRGSKHHNYPENQKHALHFSGSEAEQIYQPDQSSNKNYQIDNLMFPHQNLNLPNYSPNNQQTQFSYQNVLDWNLYFLNRDPINFNLQQSVIGDHRMFSNNNCSSSNLISLDGIQLSTKTLHIFNIFKDCQMSSNFSYIKEESIAELPITEIKISRSEMWQFEEKIKRKTETNEISENKKLIDNENTDISAILSNIDLRVSVTVEELVLAFVVAIICGINVTKSAIEMFKIDCDPSIIDDIVKEQFRKTMFNLRIEPASIMHMDLYLKTEELLIQNHQDDDVLNISPIFNLSTIGNVGLSSNASQLTNKSEIPENVKAIFSQQHQHTYMRVEETRTQHYWENIVSPTVGQFHNTSKLQTNGAGEFSRFGHNTFPQIDNNWDNTNFRSLSHQSKESRTQDYVSYSLNTRKTIPSADQRRIETENNKYRINGTEVTVDLKCNRKSVGTIPKQKKKSKKEDKKWKKVDELELKETDGTRLLNSIMAMCINCKETDDLINDTEEIKNKKSKKVDELELKKSDECTKSIMAVSNNYKETDNLMNTTEGIINKNQKDNKSNKVDALELKKSDTVTRLLNSNMVVSNNIKETGNLLNETEEIRNKKKDKKPKKEDELELENSYEGTRELNSIVAVSNNCKETDNLFSETRKVESINGCEEINLQHSPDDVLKISEVDRPLTISDTIENANTSKDRHSSIETSDNQQMATEVTATCPEFRYAVLVYVALRLMLSFME